MWDSDMKAKRSYVPTDREKPGRSLEMTEKDIATKMPLKQPASDFSTHIKW